MLFLAVMTALVLLLVAIFTLITGLASGSYFVLFTGVAGYLIWRLWVEHQQQVALIAIEINEQPNINAKSARR